MCAPLYGYVVHVCVSYMLCVHDLCCPECNKVWKWSSGISWLTCALIVTNLMLSSFGQVTVTLKSVTFGPHLHVCLLVFKLSCVQSLRVWSLVECDQSLSHLVLYCYICYIKVSHCPVIDRGSQESGVRSGPPRVAVSARATHTYNVMQCHVLVRNQYTTAVWHVCRILLQL